MFTSTINTFQKSDEVSVELTTYYIEKFEKLICELYAEIAYKFARYTLQIEQRIDKFEVDDKYKHNNRVVFYDYLDHLQVRESIRYDEELVKCGFYPAVMLDVDPFGETSQELLDYINSSNDLIFVRTDTYMEKAETLKQLHFINDDTNDEVEVLYVFPMLRKYYDIWKSTNGKDYEWRIVEKNDYKFAYAMNFNKTNDVVTSFSTSNFSNCLGINLEEFDPNIHKITMSNRTNYCLCGCGRNEGSRTDFDINWEVVLCNEPIHTIVSTDAPKKEWKPKFELCQTVEYEGQKVKIIDIHKSTKRYVVQIPNQLFEPVVCEWELEAI